MGYERLYIDMETYSACDIEKHGGMAYAQHPTTCMLCMSYAFDDEPVQLLKGIDPLPLDILEHVANGGKVYAQNATFDFRIWNYVCVPQLAWPELSLEQVVDSMALHLTFQVPASLKEAGAALQITMQKNPEGKRLINTCCKPDKNGLQPMPFGANKNAFDRLFAYCVRDVEAMREIVKALPREHLIEKEQKLWELTYKMNSYGLPVDRQTIKAIEIYLAEYIQKTMAQVPILTGGFVSTVNQVAKMLEWCSLNNYPLESLAADQVKIALADEDCPVHVKEVLKLRQELGRSSVAKFIKLNNLAHKKSCGNWYVFDNLQYHGAGTGRWAGRGFQVHNLPRASVPNPDEFIEAFRRGDVVPDPVSVAKALIRPMICAPSGQSLLVSDYSSIENRILHYLAEDWDTLEDFKNDVDQYKEMASARYGVPYDQVDKAQRQMGKVIILGCLAKDTLVLTQNGPKVIQDISTLDLLWDGSSWVRHEGLLDKGMKPCVCFAGAWMTRDHEVFLSEHKEQAWRHLRNSQSKKRAICLVIGELLNTFPELTRLKERLDTGLYVPYVEQSISTLRTLLKVVSQLSVELVEEKPNLNQAYTRIVKIQALIKKLSIGLSIDGTPLKLDALCLSLQNTKTTEDEALECTPSGLVPLFLLFSMLWDYPDLIIQDSNSTESTMTGTTSLVTSSLAHDLRTYQIDESKTLIEGCYVTKIVNTYDLLNAGPKHRFTILTAKGPLLVSNCGFQMGGPKFVETAKVQFGMVIPPEEGKIAVRAYRDRYPLVEELWGGLKNACAKAVITGRRTEYKKITFATAKIKGVVWLAMLLPSGKALYYMSPEVHQMFIPDYEHMGRVPTVTHMGMNPYSRKWSRLKLIPGRITENAVQGTARECMGQGLLNVSSNMEYVQPIASVHDEAISLINEDRITDSTLELYNEYLCYIPWAQDLPLKAEGYISKRYKKG